jgi:hypothetical protein
MDWPDDWWPIDAATAAAFEAELQREMSPGHPLFGLPLRAIGQGGNGDDVLFTVADGSERVAAVHLTWARAAECPPWPGSELYEGFAAWAEDAQDEWNQHQEWIRRRQS